MSTDDRIAQLEDNLKELSGMAQDLQKSVGSLLEDAKKRAKEGMEDFADNAQEAWDDAGDQAQNLWKKTRRKAKKAYYVTKDYTQEHPWRVGSSALIIFGLIGAVCYLSAYRSDESRFEELKRRYRDLF